MEENKFPEAGAVAYFGYKRTDGFEISLTLRDVDGKTLMTRLEGAITKVKEQGGSPLPLRNGFPGKQSKPKDYVEGQNCPIDGARLIKAETKNKNKYIACENRRYNSFTKKAEDCPYIKWEIQNPSQNDIPEVDYGFQG